jgi:hypothetical protein
MYCFKISRKENVTSWVLPENIKGRYVRIQADGFSSLTLYRVDFGTGGRNPDDGGSNTASWNVAKRTQPNFLATREQTDSPLDYDKVTQELEYHFASKFSLDELESLKNIFENLAQDDQTIDGGQLMNVVFKGKIASDLSAESDIITYLRNTAKEPRNRRKLRPILEELEVADWPRFLECLKQCLETTPLHEEPKKKKNGKPTLSKSASMREDFTALKTFKSLSRSPGGTRGMMSSSSAMQLSSSLKTPGGTSLPVVMVPDPASLEHKYSQFVEKWQGDGQKEEFVGILASPEYLDPGSPQSRQHLSHFSSTAPSPSPISFDRRNQPRPATTDPFKGSTGRLNAKSTTLKELILEESQCVAKKECPLCSQRMPETSLFHVVPYRSIANLQESWGVPVVKPSMRNSKSRQYDYIPVCVFCSQFFHYDFDAAYKMCKGGKKAPQHVPKAHRTDEDFGVIHRNFLDSKHPLKK